MVQAFPHAMLVPALCIRVVKPSVSILDLMKHLGILKRNVGITSAFLALCYIDEYRYPSHPREKWKFPGVGEFQCYDKYMMEDLKMAACQKGRAEWGGQGPQNAGGYNSLLPGLAFFEEGEENFLSDYGHFFLEWYSGSLIQHADAILARVKRIFCEFQDSRTYPVLLVAKIGTVYWWYQSISHAAELTTGYYNTAMRDGYDPLVSVLSQYRMALHISSLEMCDNETLLIYMCSPKGLIKQLREVSKKWRVHVTGRNTKERFDEDELCQVIATCHQHADAVRSFTYFRLNEHIFNEVNWIRFVSFVRKMNGNL